MNIDAEIRILQAMRPRLTMQELVELKSPVADFEFNDRDRWFYSVKEEGYLGPGSLLEGSLICVHAPSAGKAETLAQEGLRFSIEQFSAYLNTGPQVTAETRPAP